ncbi:pilus assembly protein TadE [Vibrio sp. HA2012]|uniref:TadE/TadG family type IV pilus assembly protein n=1 Tax=Vibrio sp. HA2012 TaxID=1971595 RepID=UPI000C2BB9CC|nr:TadE/TadG family type IV pilus assembly protein [Vibrio sp. HA2012]PJC86105.1 pilus assembly protein TadE [Vibrio sp. HA2012]
MKAIKRTFGRAWQKGVASIEFALGFFAFWLLIAAWAEMSYISYVTAIGDLAISEASRSAKKGTDKYQEAFENVLVDSNHFWSKFVDTDGFVATVRYVKDLSALQSVTGVCQSPSGVCDGPETDKALAIYYISYDYNSIFGYFVQNSSVFAREIIVVQEYERDKFEI